MWYLKSTNGVCFYLIGKNEFTIGRKNTDFILNNDDSISRTHARITIDIEITSEKMLPIVHVTDAGSKYGTYIDAVQLKPQQKMSLKENNQLKLGLLESCFTLHQLKLCVITSNIKQNDRAALQNCLEYLKATKASEWSDNCSHLVVSDFILTIKVLCALTLEKPIVNIAFFNDLVTSVKTHTPVPDYKKYLPELNESLLSKNIKVEYKSERRSLFKDKILVFASEKKNQSMEDLIKATGGKTVSWKQGKCSRSDLEAKSPEYLFIESNLDEQSSSISASESFYAAIDIIKNTGRRTIPFQEIALAIIHCSITEFCNSSINKTKLLIPDTQTQRTEHILAYDTQHATTTQHSTIAPIIVPESYGKETITPVFFHKPNVDRNAVMGPSVDRNAVVGPSVSEGGLGAELRTSGKRSLEPEASSNAKRFRDGASTSSGSTSEFPFNRASNSNSGTKQSMFSFKETDTVTNEDIVDNPFAKKRKATSKILEPPAKKSPLTNISNQLTDRKPDISNITDSFLCITQITSKNSPTSTSFSNMSVIAKATAWFGNLNIKKELDEDLISENGEEDTEQALIRRRNESFKNSTIIEILPMVTRRPNLSHDSGNVTTTPQNYKKFKKVQHSFIQTKIVENMVDFVVGNIDLSEDEQMVAQEVDDEFDDFDQVGVRIQTKSRRKFGYAN